MSTPIRESILSALATRLSASRLPARADMATGIFISDEGEEAILLDYAVCQATMNIRAESLSSVLTAESRATGENRLLSALIKTTIGTDRTLSSKCDDIVYTGGGPLLMDDPTIYIGAYANFAVTYRYDAGNPETLSVY